METNSRTLSAVLGGSPELALFEAFAFRAGTPISPVDASRFSGVAWATAHRKIVEWAVNGVLNCVGKEGKSKLYVLNSKSQTVNILSKAVRSAVVELFEAENKLVANPNPDVEISPRTIELSGKPEDFKWANTSVVTVMPA